MKKDRQQNRNKRILVAILMLLVTGIALTTATYAWFSANTIVTATGIDVKVTASAGIAISADAKNFGKETSMADVIAFAKEDTTTYPSRLSLPEKLSPVSTGGLIEGDLNMNFYSGELGENNVVNLTAATEYRTNRSEGTEPTDYYTSGDFIAFDLYFRSSAVQNIKLNGQTTIGIREAVAATGKTQYLQSAVRIGFINLGTSDDTSADGAQASAYNLANPVDWKIWNPYPYLHHASTLSEAYGTGESEATNGYYGANNVSTGVGNYDETGSAATGDNYVKFLFDDVKDDSTAKAIQNVISTENTHYVQGTAANNILPAGSIFTVGAGVTKIRVYVWLEGNDADCVDAISISDGLTINLGFEVNGIVTTTNAAVGG